MLPSPPHCATNWPPGRSSRRSRANSAVVVEDPVKRGRRDHGVDRLGQLELEQVAADHGHAIGGQALARALGHRDRAVDGDHVPARQPLEHHLGDAPGAGAGVEHGLIARQHEPLDDRGAPQLLRGGDAVVAVCVPVAGRHRGVRYRIRSAVITHPRRRHRRSDRTPVVATPADIRKILVVGAGGREHAIVRALLRSRPRARADLRARQRRHRRRRAADRDRGRRRRRAGRGGRGRGRRLRRRRSGGAARGRPRRSPHRARDRGVRAERGGGSARGLEGVRQAGDGAGRRADRALDARGHRRARGWRRSSATRRCSRPTAWPPARAS